MVICIYLSEVESGTKNKVIKRTIVLIKKHKTPALRLFNAGVFILLTREILVKLDFYQCRVAFIRRLLCAVKRRHVSSNHVLGLQERDGFFALKLAPAGHAGLRVAAQPAVCQASIGAQVASP